jgi:hypothetical protein
MKKLFLCLLLGFWTLDCKGGDYVPLLPSPVEQLRLWDRVLNPNERDNLTQVGLTRLEIKKQIEPYLENALLLMNSGDLQAAPCFLAAIKLKWRLLGTKPDLNLTTMKALHLLNSRIIKGDSGMAGLLAWWADYFKLQDFNVDQLHRMAADAGCLASLAVVVRGRLYFESGIKLRDDAEFYKYAIVQSVVYTTLYSSPGGLEDMFMAAEAARASNSDSPANGNDRISEAEQDAVRIIKKIDWIKLKENKIFYMDCSPD